MAARVYAVLFAVFGGLDEMGCLFPFDDDLFLCFAFGAGFTVALGCGYGHHAWKHHGFVGVERWNRCTFVAMAQAMMGVGVCALQVLMRSPQDVFQLNGFRLKWCRCCLGREAELFVLEWLMSHFGHLMIAGLTSNALTEKYSLLRKCPCMFLF